MDVRRTSLSQHNDPLHPKLVLSLAERVAACSEVLTYLEPAGWVPDMQLPLPTLKATRLLCTNFPRLVAHLVKIGLASVYVPRSTSTDCVECLFSILRNKRPTFSGKEGFDMLATVQRIESQTHGGRSTAGYIVHSTRSTNHVAPVESDSDSDKVCF